MTASCTPSFATNGKRSRNLAPGCFDRVTGKPHSRMSGPSFVQTLTTNIGGYPASKMHAARRLVTRAPRRVTLLSARGQNRQAIQSIQRLEGFLDRREMDGVYAQQPCSIHVRLPVVKEQSLGSRNAQTRQAMLVDCSVRLCNPQIAGECRKVEIGEPAALVNDPVAEFEMHVGEDGGANAARSRSARPLHHASIQMRPTANVQLN